MANLDETAEWAANITLFPTSAQLLGGSGGPLNIAPGQLANRTLWLKETLEDLETTVTSGSVFNALAYGSLSADADSTSVINAAITAAFDAGGGVVMLPARVIRCDNQILLKHNVWLVGAGAGTRLNFASAGAITACIKAAGSMALTSVSFSAAINKGDVAITFPSAPSGVAAGSLLLIYNADDTSFSSARDYYRAGEWVKVKSVSGGVVTLDGPVFDTYAHGDSTVIYVVNPVTAGIKDLSATFKAGLTGILMQLGHRCSAENLNLTGTNQSHLTTDRCYESKFKNIDAFDVSAAIGANYGIIVGNSQRIHVTDCMLDTTRHGLAIGGNDVDGCVPNRLITVRGCTITGHTAGLSGADAHGNCEYVAYVGNQLLAGIAVGGDKIAVIDNLILTTTTTNLHGVYLSEAVGPNFVIARNRFHLTGNTTGSNSAAVNLGKNSEAFDYISRDGLLSIVDNHFDMGPYTGDVIMVNQIGCLAADAVIDLDISGNKIFGTGNQTTRFGIYVVGSSTHGFKTVRVADNHLVNASIYLDKTGAGVLTVVNNDILRASVQGILIGAGSAYHTLYQTQEELIILDGNRIYRPNHTGIQLVGSSTGARTFAFLRNNMAVSACQGGATADSSTDSSLYLATVAAAVVERNTFGKLPNDSVGAQTRFVSYNGIAKLTERDNVNVGTVTNDYVNAITVRDRDNWQQTVTTSTATLNAVKGLIMCNRADGVINLTLPAPTQDLELVIVDIGGAAGTYNITLTAPSGTINDAVATTFLLNADRMSVTVRSNGTNYFITG